MMAVTARKIREQALIPSGRDGSYRFSITDQTRPMRSTHSTDLADTGTSGLGKRERAKVANREAILEAARMVFAELGYDVTTVRDIIRRTELASGTFYNYFRSKEEIYDALARKTVLDFSRILKDTRKPDMSFANYIRCAYGAYFSFLAHKHSEVLKLREPHISFSGMRVDTPEMKVVFSEIRKDIDEVLAQDGTLGIDTEYLTASAIGIARELGECMLKRMSGTPDGPHLEEATEFATHLVLNGVRHLFD